MTEKYSYKEAGVDIDLEADGVKTLINMLSYKRTGEHGMLGGSATSQASSTSETRFYPCVPMVSEQRCVLQTISRTGPLLVLTVWL